jgi:hypothetical protein
MTRPVLALLLAGATILGRAQALELALSPLVDQSGRDDATEGEMAPRPRPAPAPAPAAAEPVSRELPANPLWAIPLKQLSDTRERPIFSPSRRPPAAAVVGPPPAPATVRVPPKSTGPQSPELSLIGTVVGTTESIAVFVDDATKNAVRLHTGDAHNGWTLQSVQGREATLAKDSEIITLNLPQPGVERTAAIPSSAGSRPNTNRRR